MRTRTIVWLAMAAALANALVAAYRVRTLHPLGAVVGAIAATMAIIGWGVWYRGPYSNALVVRWVWLAVLLMIAGWWIG